MGIDYNKPVVIEKVDGKKCQFRAERNIAVIYKTMNEYGDESMMFNA